MFTVAIDFDGVLNNLPEAWKDYLNSILPKDKQIQKLDNYDMSKNFKSLSYEQIMQPLTNKDFWLTVKSEKNSKELLDKLMKENDLEILIVTATSPDCWWVKYKYCFSNLYPDFPLDNIILTSRKDLIKCDILIDDNPEFLRETKAYSILVDKSYNRNARKFYDFRCTNYDELFDKIRQLAYYDENKKEKTKKYLV